MAHKRLKPKKARKLLRDNGSLTTKQRGLFGLIASGKRPTRISKVGGRRRR